MIKLTNFVNVYRNCSKLKFLEQCPSPILLIEKQQQSEKFKTEKKGREQTLSFNTFSGEDPNYIATMNGRRIGIMPIRLSLVFDFRQCVEEQVYLMSIGRSPGSCVFLQDGAISKFHAFFKYDTDGWYVADGNSSNGTRLNGKKILANEPHLLKSYDGIMLSQIYLCTFFYPEDFFHYIQWLAKEGY